MAESSSHNSYLIKIKCAKYPDLKEDEKIDTLQFLEASRSVINIYDSLGTTLLVVKKDMLGNVEKLTKVYNKSPVKYKFLNDMIYHEKDDPNLYAVDALLWLKRALEFTVCFAKSLVNDWKKGITSESITNLVEDAYDKILKKHHNWFVQNVFKVVLKAFPYRSDALKAINSVYIGKDCSVEETCTFITDYFGVLEKNLLAIIKLYRECGLEMEDNLSNS